MNYVSSEIPDYFVHKIWTNTHFTQPYDVLILGDSTTNSAYQPEYLSERVLNLALGGTSPPEMYYPLCDYLRLNPPPKVCYIFFQDMHMHGASTLFKRTFYSHMLTWKQEFVILQQAEKYQEKSIFTPMMYRDWLSYRLRLPNVYLPSLLDSRFYKRRKTNEDALRNYMKHRGSSISFGTRETQDREHVEFATYAPPQFFDDYFRKILQLCEKNGIKVRIVMTPLIPSAQRTPEYQTEMHTYYERLKADYPSLDFVDRMEGFIWRHFCDTSHHLNIHGALKFTKAIKRRYPEDFSDAVNDPVSRNTIDGMTDYLQMENYPGEILRRVEDTDFSAVIIRWPGKGGRDEDILTAVGECYPSMSKQAKTLNERSNKDATAFFVNGLAKDSCMEKIGNDFLISDARLSQSILLRVMSETRAEVFLPWSEKPLIIAPNPDTDMTVVILNHYDNEVVAIKHFAYAHGGYVLIP